MYEMLRAHSALSMNLVVHLGLPAVGEPLSRGPITHSKPHGSSHNTWITHLSSAVPLFLPPSSNPQVSFNPLYTETLLQRSASPGDAPANGSSSGSNGPSAAVDDEQVSAEDILGMLEQGLFLHEHGLESAIGGKASEATVLLAGIRGDVASTVAKELTFKGVAWERLLFCDYF